VPPGASPPGRARSTWASAGEDANMTHPIRRIGVLTSGGDAPALNAVIRAVVKTAYNGYGWTVIGIESGFEGLVGKPRVRPLDLGAVSGLLPRGGTILGSTNKGHFTPVPTNDGEDYRDPGPYKELAANVRRLGIDALVIIGGEGSQGIACELSQYGVRAMGVPKTIDNDLYGCDQTFGFDTALTVATEAIDRLHTTAASHDRVMVLEVMGRDTGWIALHSGIGGGADIILIPEIPFTVEAVANLVLTREYQGSNFSIIVCSEGAQEAGSGQIFQEATGTLGGVGAYVATQVAKTTGKDARVVVLGHLQRGGQPTPFDRILATRFGAAAVHALAEGHYGEVVVMSKGEIGTISMIECAGRTRFVPTDHEIIRTARGLGIGFGDEDESELTPEALD
jgi:ATP-dependent phosphofructokinase / diphosphate-dependent phosphofructokinase